MTNAPAVFFAFNRPEETLISLTRLLHSEPSHVFVVLDGPRPGVESDIEKVKAVRATVASFSEENISILSSSINLGLRRRIETGLDWVFSQVDYAIIVEDDCVIEPSFFDTATTVLEAGRPSGIGMVQAGNFDLSWFSYFRATGYRPVVDLKIWGWATWAEVWQDYRSGRTCRDESLKRTQVLDREYRRILRKTKGLDADTTWDYHWVVWLLANGLVALQPSVNMVVNVGFSEEATHTKHPRPDLPKWSKPMTLSVTDSRAWPKNGMGRLSENISRLLRAASQPAASARAASQLFIRRLNS